MPAAAATSASVRPSSRRRSRSRCPRTFTSSNAARSAGLRWSSYDRRGQDPERLDGLLGDHLGRVAVLRGVVRPVAGPELAASPRRSQPQPAREDERELLAQMAEGQRAGPRQMPRVDGGERRALHLLGEHGVLLARLGLEPERVPIRGPHDARGA